MHFFGVLRLQLETGPPFYVVIRAALRSSRLHCKRSTFISQSFWPWALVPPRDSNPRLPALQSSALPTKLILPRSDGNNCVVPRLHSPAVDKESRVSWEDEKQCMQWYPWYHARQVKARSGAWERGRSKEKRECLEAKRQREGPESYSACKWNYAHRVIFGSIFCLEHLKFLRRNFSPWKKLFQLFGKDSQKSRRLK